MRACDYLLVSGNAEKGTITIFGKGVAGRVTNKMKFIGSSLPSSAKSREVYDSLSFSPKEGEEHVLAISMAHTEYDGKRPQTENYGFLLKIDTALLAATAGGKWADILDFNLHQDRLASIIDTGELSVLINAKRYWFGYMMTTFDDKQKQGFVPDSNLLCRYISGHASDEEVVEASNAFVEEPKAKEQVAVLQVKLAKTTANLQVSTDALINFGKKVEEMENQLGVSQEALKKCQWKFDSLINALAGKWFIHSSVRGWIRDWLKEQAV